MEAAVANVVSEGMRGVVIVTGYFGDRLAQIFERYGARVRRIDVEWGRAVDPAAAARRAEQRRRRRRRHRARRDVHRRPNPVKELAAIAREHGALTIVDTVTSLGGHRVRSRRLGRRRRLLVQPEVHRRAVGHVAGGRVGRGARERLVKCRSFYLDLRLLEDYWLGRKYHHTLSTSLIYALREALLMVEEEGLEARYARHERHHHALAAGVEAMGLSLLPPAGERLWTLNTVRVPAGVDEAAVRKTLLTTFNHRGRRRPRSAGRQDLARGPDGRQLDAADAAAVPGRARSGARDARPPCAGRRRRCRGRGGARRSSAV